MSPQQEPLEIVLNQGRIPEHGKLDIIPKLLQPAKKIVLVPVKGGTKRPTEKRWTELSVEEMSNHRYIHRLQKAGNTAVLLGVPSGGVCCIDIDIDDPEAIEKFLDLNPKLRNTLHTRGKRGIHIWLIVRSKNYPGITPLKTRKGNSWGEFRSTGSMMIIHGMHPSGVPYTIVNLAKLVEIEFSEINWPDDLILPWENADNGPDNPELEGLTEKYGAPFFFTKEGVLKGINERFWAGLFALENKILFESNHGQFYLYDTKDGLWKVQTSEAIRELVAQLILRCSRDAGHVLGERMLTKNRLDAVIAALKGITEHRGAFDNKAQIIHVANGVIRFNKDGTFEFGPPTPEDFSRNMAPVPYVKDAKCRRFLEELLGQAMNPEDVSLLQRWFGLALFGSNKAQRFLLLEGTAGGGKTTIALIVKGLVGFKNICQLRPDCLNERFEMSRYNGRTVLMGSDVPGYFLNTKGASTIKSLVGGDPITAEAKGLNTVFDLNGDFNIILTCNSRLRVRLDGDHAAWRRRILVIPFKENPPKKRIPHFDQVLLSEEGSGILNWALQGFSRLLTELKETGDFVLTDTQKTRTDILLSESDSLREFLTGYVEKSNSDDLTSDELKECYASYCISQEWDPLPIRTIERQLPDLMLELFQVNKSNSIRRGEGRSVRGYRNVRLKEPYGDLCS